MENLDEAAAQFARDIRTASSYQALLDILMQLVKAVEEGTITPEQARDRLASTKH